MNRRDFETRRTRPRGCFFRTPIRGFICMPVLDFGKPRSRHFMVSLKEFAIAINASAGASTAIVRDSAEPTQFMAGTHSARFLTRNSPPDQCPKYSS